MAMSDQTCLSSLPGVATKYPSKRKHEYRSDANCSPTWFISAKISAATGFSTESGRKPSIACQSRAFPRSYVEAVQLLPVLVDEALPHDSVDRLADLRSGGLRLQGLDARLKRGNRGLALRGVCGGGDVAVLGAVLFVLELVDFCLGGDQLGDDDLVVFGFFYKK